MRSAASALAALVFCTGAAHAAAPDQPSGQAPAQPPDQTTVTVTAKRADPRRDDTAAKVVVKRDELTSHGDTQLGDALKRIPGVSVSGDSISLRGMGGYTQVLLNGEKPPAGFSLTSLSPDMVERVEVSRAPTADTRTEAIGGTINIILRKVVKTDGHDWQLTAAENNDRASLDASAAVSGRRGRLSYVVSGAASHREGAGADFDTQTVTDPSGNVVSIRDDEDHGPYRENRLSLTPNLTLGGDDGASLSIQGLLSLRHQQSGSTRTSVALFGPALPFVTNPQSATFDIRSTRLDFDRSQPVGDATLKLKLSLSNYHRDGLARQRGFDGAGVLALDDTITSVIDETGLTTSGKYATRSNHGHSLEAGWDGGVSWRYETRIERDAPLPGSATGGLLGDSDLIFHATVRRAAVYVQDNWTVTPRWSVYLGLRDETLETLSQGSGYAPIDNRVSSLSPIVQSLWKLPDDKGQFRLALARTFKAPTFDALIPRPYVNVNNTALNPDSVGNPNLKPEIALGLDASYEHYWTNNAMVSIGGFVRHIDGVLRSDTFLSSGRWVRSQINGGTADVEGLEFEAKASLNQLIAAAPPVELHVSLERNWSKVADLPPPGNILPGQRPLTATLEAEDALNPRWTIGGSYEFAQGVTSHDTVQQLSIDDDVHEIDLYAVRSLGKTLKLRFSLDNALRRGERGTVIFTDATGTTRSVGRAIGPSTFRVSLERKY
jgi:outer membrane receptor protein involved in Fe transport